VSGIDTIFSAQTRELGSTRRGEQVKIAMNGLSPNATMALIGPGILAVFGVVFFCAWLIEKKHVYLLLLAIACGLFGLAACSQILALPSGAYSNAVVSGLLYTSAVVVAAEGILLRAGRQLGVKADVAIIGFVTALIWYYAYVTPFLLARVYIQNFGYGTILLVAALRLIAASRTRLVDRVLFWVLLVFALQFFPRTLLTIGLHAPTDAKAFGQSSFWQVLQLSIAVLGAALAFAILAATVADIFDDLRRERDVDPLTNVLNRRGFEEGAARLFARSASFPLTLVLCDLDRFKSINDTYGHGAGDTVLKAFGAILCDRRRPSDLVGRLGGEEFAILLPDTPMREAVDIAERIRAVLERTSFGPIPPSRPVTASFGIGERHPGDQLHDLHDRVDRCLYLAKSGGRNRIVTTDLANAPEIESPLLQSDMRAAPPRRPILARPELSLRAHHAPAGNGHDDAARRHPR